MSLQQNYDKDCPINKNEKEESTSLISFNYNNIKINNIINNIQAYKDDNIKVVSIIGSARMGKSALLNIIISKYKNFVS